jgi:hypothetical protein
MKHDADESRFGIWARNMSSSDATHRGGNHESNTSGGCLRSVCDAGSDGECLEGRCPGREPRTTWRAKPLFDRGLNASIASRAIREPRNDEFAGAETVVMVERNMCGTVMQGADALPGSKATSRAKGSYRNLGYLASDHQSCVRGMVRIGKARSRSR